MNRVLKLSGSSPRCRIAIARRPPFAYSMLLSPLTPPRRQKVKAQTLGRKKKKKTFLSFLLSPFALSTLSKKKSEELAHSLQLCKRKPAIH